MNRFNGNGIVGGGSDFRTGGSERRYTTIDARSSSAMYLYWGYGITGKSVRPSWPMPSRMARASWSSVHVPAPVLRSGVMLGAARNGNPSSAHDRPLPSVPGFTVKLDQSTSEWHAKQRLTDVTR